MKKTIKVAIEPGCITCGLCEFLAPDVFEVTDVSHVKPDADVQEHEKEVMQAVESCPVQVIVCTQKNE